MLCVSLSIAIFTGRIHYLALFAASRASFAMGNIGTVRPVRGKPPTRMGDFSRFRPFLRAIPLLALTEISPESARVDRNRVPQPALRSPRIRWLTRQLDQRFTGLR